MISNQERSWIYSHAYLPEHLPHYVGAVSGAEAYFLQNYLFFLAKKHLIFIGYPLQPDSHPPARIYDLICNRYQPTTAAVIASDIWLPAEQCQPHATDSYYRLDLPVTSIDASVAYMLRRARKELKVARGRFQKEHKKVIKAFLSDHSFNRQQKYLFRHIPQYLKASDTAVMFEARKENKLVAFNILDLGSADCAFYLFSFRSGTINVPGASDLLFHEMVKLAQAEGKKTLNLGLGVNAGIRRFKEKWGGTPFLNYSSVLVDKREIDIGRLAKKL